ncbi:YkgJ family cysteine cluster protein [Methanofollis formosanus]|uniref:YkgJ family cysteine cluster protein n=1 Tax=Methanofollis formosanus TaxID=299308 RepID=A0A8G1A094_9EURY|nr:YkgJ family cysteine cluster protein [Methanofollis formosanus]QYZ78093.1 YkgJ family cysteine cluster protein [Methanofollis formosanus]
MPFTCIQCGECCSHLGDVHVVTEACGDGRFVMLNRYTGEEHAVRIDPDKLHLFPDRSISERWPQACPFLRDDPAQNRICCIIHLTRPEICREYACWRLLILNARGRRVGRVMERRHLATDDPGLAAFWERSIRTIREDDDAGWDERAIEALTQAGYRVRR